MVDEEDRILEVQATAIWRQVRDGRLDPEEGFWMLISPSPALTEAATRAVREGHQRHGTHTQYLLGCRCELCTEAHAERCWSRRGVGKTNGRTRS